MYKISVTTIEKFRRYQVGASARDTEVELLQSIKGVFEGNDLTDVGEGYHKIMEGEAQVADGGLIAHIGRGEVKKSIFFTADQARPALDFREAHPLMIHEIPVKKIYETKIGSVLISGRVDGQEGLETSDKKCKFSPPKFQEYIDSYQWRFYEDMLGTSLFWYDLFEVKGFKALAGSMPYQLPDVSFHAHERLQCVRYPRMSDDCLSLLNDFLDYIDLRGLWQFLKTVPEVTSLVS